MASGFFRLETETFGVVVPRLEAVLGRAKECSAEARAASMQEEPARIPISSSKNVSREHAVIRWSQKLRRWEILCSGRNGLYLNKQFCQVGEIAPLRSGDAILIGATKMFFLLPIPE